MCNKTIALALAATLGLAACETDREVALPQAPEAPSLATAPTAADLDANPHPSTSIVPEDMPVMDWEQFRLSLSVSPASLSGKAIAYDMSHNTGRQALTSPTGSNMNSTIFGDYAAAGATITVITTFDAATLSGFDVLWLEEDFSSFLSATEKTDLANFVAAGGGLVICCEEWAIFTGDFGSPLKVFGMNYGGAGGFGTTTNIFAHPTTVGVTAIQFSGSARGLTFPATATALFDNPAGTSTHGVGLQSGIGRVVAISDEFCFNGAVVGADNRLFCNQMLDWVANPIIIVDLDIKPTSCPNPLNVHAKGVLPAAILGTGTLDVTDVDPATVLLEGVAPLRWTLEDVATPFGDPLVDRFSCTEDGPDGFTDLTLKFDRQAIAAALGAVADGDEVILTLTGNTFGGAPIQGQDIVFIIDKK